MLKKVLVTGGAGFVGHHLVKRLLELKCEVVIIDDLSTGLIGNISNDAIFVKGDILDDEKLSVAAKGCDTIFHLAARVELQKSIMDPADCFSVNVTGTSKVVMECLKNNDRRLIFASSCAVYPLNPTGFLKEEMAIYGNTPYALSKSFGEKILSFYIKNSGLNACSLRCFNIYGFGQRADSPYAAVIAKFISQAIAKQNLKLYGGGAQSRDFININDVINSYILAAKSNLSGPYNVGTGQPTSIYELSQKIISIIGDGKIENAPSKKGDALNSCADLTKIRNELGFNPEIDLESGLNLLIEENK
jgi:UDP-glucose 4-epimerase